jgi:predicted amino acid dehydrogenase
MSPPDAMPQPDFALIAHFETWERAAAAIALLRGSERRPIALEDIRDILPWIPPRTCSRVAVRSSRGHQVHGVYIDSFIPPDRLDSAYVRENIARVRDAARFAIREGARIVTLGGFSSILLEGKTQLLPSHPETAFTTGNTLTVALIVKGVARALALAGRDLAESNILIVGASGDVGSGCARCLGTGVRELLLCARNPERLGRLASELSNLGSRVTADTDLRLLVAEADVVICAASLPGSSLLLDGLPPDSIVCDAGYPRNLAAHFARRDCPIFYGGLGQVSGGIRLEPDLLGVVYPYSPENVAHGCLLEGVVLAMERRFEPYSQGRGLITPERVEEIWKMAQKHGVGLPSLFNGKGPAEEDIRSLAGIRR